MKFYQSLKNLLFIDIETVREYPSYEAFLKEKSFDNWERLIKKQLTDETSYESEYNNKAGLYPEYGKIVSFAWGRFDVDHNKNIGAISNLDENELLKELAFFFERLYSKYPETILCGHNIKEFDLPFIIKRMVLYKINIPDILLNFLNSKPWEQKISDTMLDWRMGGTRFSGLELISEFLNIPSSKIGEVKGNNLSDFYWNYKGTPEERKNLIDNYCKEDIRVVMELSKRFYDVL